MSNNIWYCENYIEWLIDMIIDYLCDDWPSDVTIDMTMDECLFNVYGNCKIWNNENVQYVSEIKPLPLGHKNLLHCVLWHV